MSSDFEGVIVVPTDFGEQSLIALKQSYNLAKLTKSSLYLLYVIDEDFLKPFQGLMGGKGDYENHLKEDVERRLKELAETTRKESGIKVNSGIRTGKIYHEIVDAAKELNASLILMGTMGAVGLKKKILGSNASRVVREAECPVITIKGTQHRVGCRHIVLPLDLTKETKEKVDKSIDLATLFGSIIHIVTIVDSDDEFVMNKLTRQMNQVQEFIEQANIKCTTEFVTGSDVAEEVIGVARRVQADLIMIMTQQEVGFTDLFISSSAQEIINHSEIPVLSIRPMPKKDTTVFMIS
jgi:nucleotide-binding universal stress UspA family protein